MLKSLNFYSKGDNGMELNSIVDAIKAMVLGMGTVFLFLSLMVFILNIQAKIISKYFPDKPKPIKESNSNDNEDEIIAVITSAIMKFRSGV